MAVLGNKNDSMLYAVVFHLDVGRMVYENTYTNLQAAVGRAYMLLQRYVENDLRDRYDSEEDLYITPLYLLDGGENYGMSLRAFSASCGGMGDEDLADVWILVTKDE